jgi:hypothetical protein
LARVGGENVREDKIESQIDGKRKRVNTDGKCGQDEIKKNLDAVTIKGSGLFESCLKNLTLRGVAKVEINAKT